MQRFRRERDVKETNSELKLRDKENLIVCAQQMWQLMCLCDKCDNLCAQ